MKPTAVFDTYWRFAAERHAMYTRRLAGGAGPWTDDPILRTYRFTNVYRAADRVSQFLISEVQHGPHRSQAPAEVLFRTILFKLFNRVETWRLLEERLGPVSWQASRLEAIAEVLDAAFARGVRLYSAAYIMPAPRLGAARKHANHLALLRLMMEDGLHERIASAGSLADVFRLLTGYPSLGRFLAFQYTIDLNYSSLISFKEDDFVVAGPGALDGISKCFVDVGDRTPEEVIHWVADNQEREFASRGLNFGGLFGRRLQPIDCQNLFCEISKYARVAYPEVKGIADRTRIKQRYKPAAAPLPRPSFPPAWRLQVPEQAGQAPPACLLALIDAAAAPGFAEVA
jgi:hypothetical protein